MSTVAIIDYGSGNLRSAAKAFERAARDAGRPDTICVTAEPQRVADADAVVLPGVGAFADCRRGLAAVDGMIDALTRAVVERGRPFLGICVGMQLMGTRGLEHGETPGLGWLAGDVVALRPAQVDLKVPHMGWNELELRDGRHSVLLGLKNGAAPHAYFVHGYHLAVREPAAILATVSYGGEVVAMVGRDNMIGVQFHPEKSQALGLRLIANFLSWRP